MARQKDGFAKFLSTSPARGTTRFDYPGDSANNISIHVPREGDDTVTNLKNKMVNISIHVPREGDDLALPLSDQPETGISIHVPREGDDCAKPAASTS